jgi:hypothetical protein
MIIMLRVWSIMSSPVLQHEKGCVTSHDVRPTAVRWSRPAYLPQQKKPTNFSLYSDGC